MARCAGHREAARRCAGKYSVDADGGAELPQGPRGQLFRQILPESRGVREALRDIAEARGVSESQVRCPPA